MTAPVTPGDRPAVEPRPDAVTFDGGAVLAEAGAPEVVDAGAPPPADPDAGSDAERVVCPHDVVVRSGVARFPCDIELGSRFRVPDAWRTIVFDTNVTLTGSLFVPRDRTTELTIRGRDRHTSRLHGTGQFASGHEPADRERSAVFSESPDTVFIRDPISLDPDKIHLVSYGGGLGVERVDLNTTTDTATTDDSAEGTVRSCAMALISWAGKSFGKESVRDLTLRGLTRRAEPGASSSPTYQFGSGGGSVRAATIRVDGYCDGRADVIQRHGSDGVVSLVSACP